MTPEELNALMFQKYAEAVAAENARANWVQLSPAAMAFGPTLVAQKQMAPATTKAASASGAVSGPSEIGLLIGAAVVGLAGAWFLSSHFAKKSSRQRVAA
jgi:hypothetical protein